MDKIFNILSKNNASLPTNPKILAFYVTHLSKHSSEHLKED